MDRQDNTLSVDEFIKIVDWVRSWAPRLPAGQVAVSQADLDKVAAGIKSNDQAILDAQK